MRDYGIMYNDLLAGLLYMVLLIYMNRSMLRKRIMGYELHVLLMCVPSSILPPTLG